MKFSETLQSISFMCYKIWVSLYQSHIQHHSRTVSSSSESKIKQTESLVPSGIELHYIYSHQFQQAKPHIYQPLYITFMNHLSWLVLTQFRLDLWILTWYQIRHSGLATMDLVCYNVPVNRLYPCHSFCTILRNFEDLHVLLTTAIYLGRKPECLGRKITIVGYWSDHCFNVSSR